MRALREISHRARERDRTHGQSAGDRFGETEDVRDDVVLLEGEHRPRAAETGLHLVEDEERAALAADAAGLRDELARRRSHAALALHELDNEGGGLGRDRIVQRL